MCSEDFAAEECSAENLQLPRVRATGYKQTNARRAFPTRKPCSTSNFQRTHSDRYWRCRQIGQLHLPIFTDFYRLEPFHQRFVRSEMTKDYQRLPKFEFSTGCPPKTFTKPLPFLYQD
jgi:hypothetical protein